MTFVFTVTLYGCGSDTNLFRPRVWTFANYEPAYRHFLDEYDRSIDQGFCENKWSRQFRNQRYDPNDTSQEEIVIEERTGVMGMGRMSGPKSEKLDESWTSWGIIITRSATR
jgi:hypothetical protein